MARHFTKEELAELRAYLITDATKDTDFPVADDITNDDCIAIIQNGINKKATVNELKKGLDTGPQGESAYEVAVRHGYIGTEEEWLEDEAAGAKGRKGDKGDKGDTGEKGRKGDKGDKGDTGNTGPVGPQGAQGNSGYSGAAGELEIVNNLSDGGAAAALSAEMGKQLGNSVNAIDSNVQFSNGQAVSASCPVTNTNDSRYNIINGLSFIKGVTYTLNISLSSELTNSISFNLQDSFGTRFLNNDILLAAGVTTASRSITVSENKYGLSVYYSWYYASQFGVTITCSITPNSAEKEILTDNVDKITALRRDVYGESATFTFSGLGMVPYSFKEGRRYRIANSSASAVTVSIRATEEGDSYNTTNIYANSSKIITAAIDASYLRCGAAAVLTVNPVDNIFDDIDANKSKLADVSDIVIGLDEVKQMSALTFVYFETVNGHDYTFTNLGESAVTVSIAETASTDTRITSFDLYPNVPKVYSAKQTGFYIRSGAATTLEIASGGLEMEYKKQDSLMYQGQYAVESVLPYSGGNTVDIPFNFKTGGQYDVDITTSTIGDMLVLYLGNTQLMTYSSFGGSVTVRVIPDKAYNKVRLYFGSSYPEGNVTVNIKYTERENEGIDYQFGIGINCKYDTPTQPAFNIPVEANRPGYFYQLFDTLVASYPNYVTKVDCDAYANEHGITTPAYMDGCPIYMYQFLPTFTPGASTSTATAKSVMKVMILGGTHPELTSIQDLYNTMKIVCESWMNDDNISALRHEVEFYVVPCSGPYTVKSYVRTNYNGVDLNRNMPTAFWKKKNEGTNQYTGPTAGSEYESKVLISIFDLVKPDVFIDHHNADRTIGKNIIYITSSFQKGVDVGAAHISAMSQRWKIRYPNILPQDDTVFGFAQITQEEGSRSKWACEQGVMAYTYESNEQIFYEPGTNTANVMTMATDGFLNFLLRALKSYSEWSSK